MNGFSRINAAAATAILLALGSGFHAATADSVVLEGRYFDGRGEVVEQGEIVIQAGRIRCAGPAGKCDTAGFERVRSEGGTILPGLIDLHVHARPLYLGAFPAAGVTTIRDANNSLATVDALKAQENGPRVLASGPLLDGKDSILKRMSPTAGRPGEQDWEEIVPVLLETPAQARAAVRELAARGVEVIKLYDRLPESAFSAAADEARRQGVPVMADLGVLGTSARNGASVDALQAVAAGIDSVEHLSGFALAYQRLGGNPLDQALDEELLDRLVNEFAAGETAVVPTLVTATHFAQPDDADLDVPLAEQATRLLGGQWQQRLAWTKNERVQRGFRADYRLAGALLPRLVENDVLIGAGTDTPAAPNVIPGGGIHQELAYLVELGLSEEQAIKAATGNAARILGRKDLGVIEKGAVADLVLVAGDPFEDIRHTREIQWVMLGGEMRGFEDLEADAFQSNDPSGESAAH